MLRNTDIEQDYYRSKYREPISDPPSKKNKEFAEVLEEILGWYYTLSLYTIYNTAFN
ncbi:MAG: hypothetical protein HDS59_00550 [Barnesiella sp.]|nr:hypothetical protein [Barnesiella sp.]